MHVLFGGLLASMTAGLLRPVLDSVEEFLNDYHYDDRCDEDEYHDPEIAPPSLESEGASGNRNCTDKPRQGYGGSADGK